MEMKPGWITLLPDVDGLHDTTVTQLSADQL